MKNFISNNRVYFILYLCFLLMAGFMLLSYPKEEIIMYFSGHRTVYFNQFFKYFTYMGDWIPYVILFTVFLFIRIRYSLLVALTGLLVLVTAPVFKEIFDAQRPLPYLESIGLLDKFIPVDGVYINRGNTSLPSGHTYSAFALFSLAAFLVRRHKRWLNAFFFCCALLTAVSRMYLAQHFLIDTYLGSLTGVTLAVFIYFFQLRFLNDGNHWAERRLNLRK